MTARVAPVCALGVSTQTLSTWRAQGLGAAEAERVGAHVGTCAACHAHLAAYDAIDALLRAQRSPVSTSGSTAESWAVSWARLRPRLVEAKQVEAKRTAALRNLPHLPSPPPVWQVLTAVAAILLVVFGVSMVLRGWGGGRASTIATATVVRPPTVSPSPTVGLGWHAVSSLPANVSVGLPFQAQADFAISPARGRRAWICAPTDPQHFTIWVTQDLGSSWQAVSTLSPVTSEPVGSCRLAAAASDPDLVGVEFWWGSGGAGTLRALSFISADGGAHWRQLPGEMDLGELDQVGGTTFAILVDTAAQADSIFVVSRDGLRTWHALTPPGLAAHDEVFQFWVQPTTGQLLAATYMNTLWRSEDAGAHWLRLQAPGQVSLGIWLPRSQRWLLCSPVKNAPTTPACSEDLGSTWTPLPDVGCPIEGLTIDGAVLGICRSGGQPADQPADVTRLQVGAATATYLGRAPWPLIYFAPTGEMWSVHGQQAVVTVLPVQAS